MWNYSFVVPSALMMITLLGFYVRRPRLPVRMNRTYVELLIIELSVLASDIISTRADELYTLFSPATLYVANTLFFVLFLVRMLWFYRFMTQMLHLSAREHPLFTMLSMLPFVVAQIICITSFATGAVFSIGESGYVSGPLYPLVSVIYFIYIILSWGLLFANRAGLRTHDFATGFFYNLALFVGTVTRVSMPKLLVMDTFCMVAIAMIYLGILNPDLYLSEHGDCFNMRGLRLVLSEPSHNRDYGLLGLALQNYNHERSILGGRQMDGVVALVINYLKKTFPNMMVFYLHGGRFVIMGESSADWKRIQATIHDRFTKVWQRKDTNLRLSVAFVYADATSELDTAERIMDNLVIALDNAKRTDATDALDDLAGPLTTKQVDQQVNILRALRSAIDGNKVEVFFQPLIDANTRKLVGAEALARIRDDAGQLVPAGTFIPIAESSGSINELGGQVLQKTCEFIRAYDLEGMGVRWVNVNLSPIQCLQQDLAKQFEDVLSQNGVPSSMIRLEITERSMLDYSLLQRQIGELEGDGFKFVMDDYGSGYSNLVRIKQYPFVNIKLDMEIVWDYFEERDVLLPTIVRGFREMGLSITAEGIESEEMAQAVTDIGVDYLQGFYFSKPLPPEEFVSRYASAQ